MQILLPQYSISFPAPACTYISLCRNSADPWMTQYNHHLYQSLWRFFSNLFSIFQIYLLNHKMTHSFESFELCFSQKGFSWDFYFFFKYRNIQVMHFACSACYLAVVPVCHAFALQPNSFSPSSWPMCQTQVFDLDLRPSVTNVQSNPPERGHNVPAAGVKLEDRTFRAPAFGPPKGSLPSSSCVMSYVLSTITDSSEFTVATGITQMSILNPICWYTK